MKRFVKISCKTISFIFSFITLISYSSCSSDNETKVKASHKIIPTKNSSIALKEDMRKLWEDHIVWTRNVIFCTLDELPGKDDAIKRLLQNQIDIGNAIKPYYGDDNGQKLTALLFIHINVSVEVLNALKTKNKKEFENANTKWSENSDEIAVFFSEINSNWKLDHMKTMMELHLKLTSDEADNRFKKDYNADVIAYDIIHVEILKMADMLSDGIIKQFPEKF